MEQDNKTWINNEAKNQLIEVKRNDDTERVGGTKVIPVNKSRSRRKVNLNDDSYRCNICNRLFNKLDNLKLHLDSHMNVNSIINCTEANVQTIKDELNQTNIDSEPYCNVVINTYNDEDLTLPETTDDDPYLNNDNSIIKTVDNRYQCKLCPKSFSYKKSLKLHERSHTGDEPYQCVICTKRFNHASNLRIHQRIHTGEKPFACEICGKPFNHGGNLKQHMRSHTGEKPYQCKLCPKAFNYTKNLKLHERSHIELKLFPCDVCNKRFNHPSTLEVHQRLHTGDKPYQCSVCYQTFNHTSSLKRHEKTHR